MIPPTSHPTTSLSRRLASLVSLALVPPTITALVFAILVLTWQHGSLIHQVVVWVTAVLFSGVLQIVYVLYQKRQRKLTAWDVPEREMRTVPYLYSIGLGVIGLLCLLYLDASLFIWGMMLCFTINSIVLAGINMVWKVSAHMMGITGPLPFLFPIAGPWLLATLPLVILLGWSRVHLRSHTLSQVIVGALLGFGLSWVEFSLLLATGGGFLAFLW